MTNDDKIEILKKYFGTKEGCIDLSNLNIGDNDLNISGLTTTGYIDSSNQSARMIYNNNQESIKYIFNDGQTAATLMNRQQKAGEIRNSEQKAPKIKT